MLNKHNQHGEDKGYRLHRRQVTALNRDNQILADAVHAENLLGDERAGEDARDAQRNQA